MLSILIPVFNFDIRALVHELHNQTMKLSIPFEILVIDDASEQKYNIINRNITTLSNVRYVELAENIGRSRIRNRLCEMAQHEYLLFMDSDASIKSSSFIADYLCYCKGEVVVCGGTGYEQSYEPYQSKQEYQLRLHYGHKRECKTAAERSIHPNRYFSTFNFLISKSILQKVRFDERLTQYGHEDTLFGIELKRRNIAIQHIDNPLFHQELDSSNVFISKALSGVNNLSIITKQETFSSEVTSEIKLLRYHQFVRRLGLSPIFTFIYKKGHHAMEKNLQRNGSNLFYFDILRLSYLCSLSNR